jgi:regulation of enolase protein 1 (concanavalin A-like superfamily)
MTSSTGIVRTVSTTAYNAGALPNGWSDQDIGAVSMSLPGSAIYDSTELGGAFVVRGTGTDVFYDADSFHYVSYPVSGDFTFTLRVRGYYGYLHMWTKAMTMFRVDMTPGSAMFNQSINYIDNDYLYYRPVANMQHVLVSDTQFQTGTGAPVWARLQRVGNTFHEYYSQDGMTWTEHGSGVTVNLPTSGTVGFGVCGKSNSYLSEIVYSDVTVTMP